MASIEKLCGWFEIEGKRYGPATCDITEEVNVSPRGTTSICVRGTFSMETKASSLPLHLSEGTIILEDKRKGTVLFTSIIDGRRGEFYIQEELQPENIAC